MSEQRVIIDTGPLIAYFDARDTHHSWARKWVDELPTPFVTCEPVLSEAAFLLKRIGKDPFIPMQLLQQGDLVVDFKITNEAANLETLMKRYANVPMSLADACLVRLSEIHKDCRVFTLDKDFKIYRRYGRSVIPVISPW